MALNRDFERACELAVEIDESSGRRRSVPVRAAFARDMKETKGAPMGNLIAIGGRGGEVLLKLHAALIWRSSAKPFATKLSARKWAELLALPDPAKNGARRITDALRTLADHRLIAVEQRRGEPPIVTLLREDGSGQTYSVPRGAGGDYYFQIPAQLWTTGQLQKLKAPGLAMLMAVLADQESSGAPVWWSTTRFPGRYGLSPATRARGTRELQEAGLLVVERKLMPPTPGKSFSVDRVRNIYRVSGAALLEPPPSQADLAQPDKAPKRRGPAPGALSPEEVSARITELLEQLGSSQVAAVKST
jgi:hypothetical protein